MVFVHFTRHKHKPLDQADKTAQIERSRAECDAYFQKKMQIEAVSEYVEDPKGVRFVMNPYTERIHRRKKRPERVPMSRYARELAGHKSKHTPILTHIKGASK